MYVHVALVRRLSPPADWRMVGRRLNEIERRLGQARFRELAEDQTTKATRQQLKALQADLKSLKPRAWRSLNRAFQDVLREDPLHRLLSEDPAHDKRCSGLDGPYLMLHTVERALADLTERKRGNPGRLGEAGRQATRELVELYCQSHGTSAPTWDAFNEDVRDPEPLDFALQCLSTWKRCDAADLTPKDIIRSL